MHRHGTARRSDQSRAERLIERCRGAATGMVSVDQTFIAKYRWTVAGLDSLLCVSFGRPSLIHFYTTNLPQHRTDDDLSELPGTAAAFTPSSSLFREMTEATFHTAHFQLTIPSLEVLRLMFQGYRNTSGQNGWILPQAAPPNLEPNRNTYDDAVKLGRDIREWYSRIPHDMRFDPEKDTAESLLKSRSPLHINQTLALCAKTHMLV